MARPKGTKYIENPQKMWDLFIEYIDEVKTNPRTKREYVGRDGTEVDTPLERPLTLSGFEVFVMNYEGIKSKGIMQYFSNQDSLYSDYIDICSRIKKIIRTDQIEGGMVGQYNPSITQRLNNLSEKVEQTNIEKPIFKGIDLDVHGMD